MVLMTTTLFDRTSIATSYFRSWLAGNATLQGQAEVQRQRGRPLLSPAVPAVQRPTGLDCSPGCGCDTWTTAECGITPPSDPLELEYADACE
eukprot:4225072-Amphidinium_carterae.2